MQVRVPYCEGGEKIMDNQLNGFTEMIICNVCSIDVAYTAEDRHSGRCPTCSEEIM